MNRGARARPARRAAPAAQAALGGRNAFSLVFGNRYILLIAVLLIVLNVVNTVGEYILSHLVVEHAAGPRRGGPGLRQERLHRRLLRQLLLLGERHRRAAAGLRGVPRSSSASASPASSSPCPLIALGAYGFVAVGATMAIVRWAKTAENSTDYSVMNTAKQLLWLPTSREEKYKAKQAVDSFFVRLGDLAGRVRGLRGHRLGDAGRERLRDRQPLLHRRCGSSSRWRSCGGTGS